MWWYPRETPRQYVDRYRRHLMRFALHGLLGLATTIAIAWGLAVFSELSISTASWTRLTRACDSRKGEPVGSLTAWRLLRTGSVRIWTLVLPARAVDEYALPYLGAPEHLVPGWARRAVLPWMTGDRPWPPSFLEGFEVNAHGWPFLALYSWHDKGQYPASGVWRINGGLAIPRAGKRFDARALPLLPIWSGLLIDTALFASLWALLVNGRQAIRRARRTRRGHCPRCDYDLGGELASGCPECGWNMMPPAASRVAATRTSTELMVHHPPAL
jgi:hypothetical protein